MPNKNKRPHGHYCKICGQHKASEKFSGKVHANHICLDGNSEDDELANFTLSVW